jgi:hypothetical protein
MKALNIWLPAWLKRDREPHRALGSLHVCIAVCDHFEPLQNTDKAGAVARIATWRREYPRFVEEFRDSGGKPPRHTFFYPVEQYDSDILQALADLCSENGCEIEVHLHHDRDTADNLRATLLTARERLASHGLLSRDPDGNVRYGFIHGNWALDHSHPEGRHCGVPDELGVLRETGCYADFTLPSAPNPTQTRTINSIYYAAEDGHPKSHDAGRRVIAEREACGGARDGELLMVQGPLGLNWRRRKYGILPRIENSDLTGGNPPTRDRFRLWLDCRICVGGRPNWLFVKLHTHGAKPSNTKMLLGEPMRAFHRMLADEVPRRAGFSYHYVTAREMVNIIHAAESGHSGDPGQHRDYRYRRVSL